jgi:DNA-binding transcriptional LysR family regulator
VDLELMKSFLVLAETRNFTRAAELLCITQSTMTTRIRTMEEWLGKPLFVRSPRNVELTPLGEAILPHIRKTVETLEECRRIAGLGDMFEERLVIGAVHSLWQTFLLDAVRSWHRSFPRTALKLVTDHSTEIIRALLDGLLDIGLIFTPPKNPEIQSIELFRDPFIAVASAKEPAEPENRSLEGRLFVHLDWGHAFSRWFKYQPLPQAVPAVEVDHAGLLIQLLSRGGTWGWVLRSVALPHLRSGVLHRLNLPVEPPPEQPIYLICRKKGGLEPKISTLVKAIQSANPDLSHS